LKLAHKLTQKKLNKSGNDITMDGNDMPLNQELNKIGKMFSMFTLQIFKIIFK